MSSQRSMPSSALSLGVWTSFKGSHLAATGRSGGGALKLRTGHPTARMSISGKPPCRTAACYLEGVLSVQAAVCAPVTP